jgi:hypothetical protein
MEVRVGDDAKRTGCSPEPWVGNANPPGESIQHGCDASGQRIAGGVPYRIRRLKIQRRRWNRSNNHRGEMEDQEK